MDPRAEKETKSCEKSTCDAFTKAMKSVQKCQKRQLVEDGTTSVLAGVYVTTFVDTESILHWASINITDNLKKQFPEFGNINIVCTVERFEAIVFDKALSCVEEHMSSIKDMLNCEFTKICDTISHGEYVQGPENFKQALRDLEKHLSLQLRAYIDKKKKELKSPSSYEVVCSSFDSPSFKPNFVCDFRCLFNREFGEVKRAVCFAQSRFFSPEAKKNMLLCSSFIEDRMMQITDKVRDFVKDSTKLKSDQIDWSTRYHMFKLPKTVCNVSQEKYGVGAFFGEDPENLEGYAEIMISTMKDIENAFLLAAKNFVENQMDREKHTKCMVSTYFEESSGIDKHYVFKVMFVLYDDTCKE